MTYTFPCTDCGVVTPTKLRKPKRCAPCAKAEALDYSRWNYRAHRDELLAQRAAGGGRGGRRDEGRSRARPDRVQALVASPYGPLQHVGNRSARLARLIDDRHPFGAAYAPGGRRSLQAQE